LGRKGHPNFLKSFHFRPLHNTSRFPFEPLGQAPPTGSTHPQSSSAFSHQSATICTLSSPPRCNFDKTPLALPGITVLAHEPANGRESFAVHAVRGYYVGRCLHHYRCFTIWMPSTNATRTVNTIDWFPHNIKMPTATTSHTIIAAAKDLATAPEDMQTRLALQQLSDIFNNATRSIHSTDADLPRVSTKPLSLTKQTTISLCQTSKGAANHNRGLFRNDCIKQTTTPTESLPTLHRVRQLRLHYAPTTHYPPSQQGNTPCS
jgi:hypothetical protein